MGTDGRTQLAATLDSELVSEIEAVAEEVGCELAWIEFTGQALRLFIDRPEGVTLADCERVSKQVSPLLDVADFGDRRYVLEVSSPGLDRLLYRPRDYHRFVGRLVRVTFHSPETRRKRTVVGRLEGYEPAGGASEDGFGGGPARGKITVVVPEDGEQLVLDLEDVHSARLEIEL